MHVLITFRNLVEVKSGSDVAMLSLFWKEFHVRIECNVNKLEPQVFVFLLAEQQGSFLLYYKDVVWFY